MTAGHYEKFREAPQKAARPCATRAAVKTTETELMNTSDLENAQSTTPLPPQHAATEPQPPASTLIEFPGANRNRPAWRKELSERVREIQQRRAREAALEAEESARAEGQSGRAALAAEDSSARAARAEERAKQLGLVPPPAETPELNPIVVAALKRIERARMPPAPPTRGRAGRAATAAARVVEERYEPTTETQPAAPKPQRESRKAQPPAADTTDTAPRVEKTEPKTDTGRLPNLVAVPPKQPSLDTPPAPAAKTFDEVTAVNTQPVTNATTNATTSATTTNVIPPAPVVERAEPKVSGEVSVAPQASSVTVETAETFDKPQPRRIEGVIDDHWLERHGADALPKVVTAKDLYDDRASVVRRCASAIVDLLVVTFLSAPFAAVIELSIGNWNDVRVQTSMGGIVFVMMFLYFTCSTALAGRTLGQRLFALHTVDANSALAPTTSQCMRRAVVYILSLATFGLGLLYALFDAEGRTAHDLLSRTVVVKE